MAVTVFEKAKANLVYMHPFFASILLRRPMIAIEDPNIMPTAGVDAKGQIYYNPKFVESLTLPQAVFLLCHEVMHVVCQHAARLSTRDHLRWNIAGDAFINDLLKADGIGEFIPGGIDVPGGKDKTTDQLYNELPVPRCAQCGGTVGADNHQGQGQQQQGQGQGQGQQGKKKGKGQGGQGQGKDHSHGQSNTPCQCPGHGQGIGGIGRDLIQNGPPMSASEQKAAEAEMKVAVAQAMQVAKMQGKVPGAIGAFCAQLIESKIPWWEKLERYMTSFSKSESTWSKRNKRYRQYLPYTGKLPMMGPIAIQIDVSGSISKPELDHYAGHLERIIEQCRPEKVHVLYVDTRVAKHLEFNPLQGDEVKLEFYSGGGTDMEEGFRYIEKNCEDVEVIVCLTDGYTSFTSAPDLPVVWVVSSSVVPTYGDHIPFEIVRQD